MIGDHLSLFLFDLVIDVFCQILKKERYARYIQGLGPELDNEHKIINFYHTYDTIFFSK
jgi:hypothetical protein